MAKTKQLSIVTLEDGTLDSLSIVEFTDSFPTSVKRVELAQLSEEETDAIKATNLLIETKAE